jgi:hypothetical protein
MQEVCQLRKTCGLYRRGWSSTRRSSRSSSKGTAETSSSTFGLQNSRIKTLFGTSYLENSGSLHAIFLRIWILFLLFVSEATICRYTYISIFERITMTIFLFSSFFLLLRSISPFSPFYNYRLFLLFPSSLLLTALSTLVSTAKVLNHRWASILDLIYCQYPMCNIELFSLISDHSNI